MQFALIDNKKTKAISGLRGLCPGCSKPVIGRCGTQRVNHWAHTRNRMCDSWWEPETEWHRGWKNNFPNELQEVFLPDEQTGEKHIADICTSQGIVIEFQHSHIHPQERLSREKFYKNLIWVVDGTRLKRDYPRFLKGKDAFRPVKKGIYKIDYPEEYFPSNWLESSVPVIFDFRGNETITDFKDMRHGLYCLFPVKFGATVIITEIPRNAFINKVISGEWLTRSNHFLMELNQVKQERQAQIEQEERLRASINFQRFFLSNQRKRRRW